MKHLKIIIYTTLFLVSVSAVIYWVWQKPPETLTSNLKRIDEKVKTQVVTDFNTENQLEIKKEKENYLISDTLKDGVQIEFANQKENAENQKEEKKLEIKLPENYEKPLEVKLDKERSILITDKNGSGFFPTLLKNQIELNPKNTEKDETQPQPQDKYLTYEDKNQRKSIIYAYQKDGANGERKLKNWIVYAYGKGKEKESYTFENAKLKLEENGDISIFYFGQKELQNEKTMAEVDENLLERAQRTLAKEQEADLINSNKTPDITIPKPFYIDKSGERKELDWIISDDQKTLSLEIIATKDDYPLALDPTLMFSAPGVSNSGSVITGEATNNYFGISMTAGDFNDDGKTDLAVGARGYNTNQGRTYIFYNDSSIATVASSADVVITGEASSIFGQSMTAGDFNADGKTDLAVGATTYNSNQGRTYIFYNGSIITENASGADITITGEASSYFGISMTAGDFNADGKADLAVGAYWYNSYQGRTYIFYNGSIITENASGADVIITGEASSYFGNSMTAGDFNADGKTDLAVGAYYYNSLQGRTYIFYNGSIITENASGADVIITGEASSYFGNSMTAGDFNADGKADLAVGAYRYNSWQGRTYIFYNGSIITENASGADVIITGEVGSSLGTLMTAGDFNADGKTDLAIGAYGYNSYQGRTYIFYNGAIITEDATNADVIITGEATNNSFGISMTAGDFNADGKTDLAIGAFRYNSYQGRTYIFYSQNGQVNTNVSITGEATNNYFSYSMTAGDFNADGKTDLAVGAWGYNSSQGRTYIFYNGAIITENASGADIIITGEATSNYFGYSMTAGDFNADGKADLAVGAIAYNTSQGRTYIFYNGAIITENASGADITITGETTYNYFGASMIAGDFNADGKTDLVVGAYGYNSGQGQGRTYIFYNGAIITENASGADIIITGEATNNYFSYSMTAGDFNADGKTDLAVGAYRYNSNQGRTYIFYNGSIITENASGADVMITGEATGNCFGESMTAGDFNADGKTDLAVGAYYYNSVQGRTYIFYNGSIITENASGADITITGEATNNYFGYSMTAGDFNADGKTDLAVGAYYYNSAQGRTYIFYNGAIITENASGADIIITGEATSNYFGYSMTAGDFNADGKTDLVVGAYTYNTSSGRAYIYETRDNYAWELQRQKLPPRVDATTGAEMKITGEATNNSFGYSMTAGDFNADGKTDLVVGAYRYNSYQGRIYIFYNDGGVPATASFADAIITGEATSNNFGASMIAGDFNADGKIDLAVGATAYNSSQGRTYIFYNGSIISENATGADITITGEATNNYLGYSMTAGDFNADGKTDLAVGAWRYNSFQGRAYIFYNGSIITENASGADITITGEATNNYFGISMTAGDFNADGKTDLAVGAYVYNNYQGRTYIFYNGSIITENASGADIIITGEATGNYFGFSMTAGDFNADGKTDLAVGSYGYTSAQGRTYIFYNGSIITENASGADITITGEATSNRFGYSMTAGDFNADGKTDLAVGANQYNSYQGRTYIFYNGSIITENASGADITITGEATSNYFGYSMTAGDFNADGKVDLVVGAYYYNTYQGRVYLYTFNDAKITGEATSNYFGISMTAGDFNADGKTDLAVGAHGYNTNQGRTYIFYSGAITTENASGADITITGEASSNFGYSMTAGDFNADGKIDLVVGAGMYNSAQGRTYIFYNGAIITENATGANIIITGETGLSFFGDSMTAGDFNADGKTDLAVGADYYNSNQGRTYIFYNGAIITENASGADITITGETTDDSFGYSMTAGDFNADGKTDLAVGANGYDNAQGRIYIFYNGSIITENASGADVMITGEATGNCFGESMTAGDFNADGKTDLVVGVYEYNSSQGRIYIFYNGSIITENASGADVMITGETTGNYFGTSMTAGDFNADGKTDLVVGAYGYNSSQGRTYIFYNGSIITENASGADVMITGETTSNSFGTSMIAGDFNADGKTDLVVGASYYNSSQGRAYVFITEVRDAIKKVFDFRSGTFKFKGSFKFNPGS